MKHFKQIFDLTIHTNLEEEYARIREKYNLEDKDQISLIALPDKPDDPYEATGSLYLDWKNAEWVEDEYGNEKLVPPKFDPPRNPSDFSVVADQFKGTVFEEIYHEINNKYGVILASMFKSKRRSCLSWHTDIRDAIHFPIKTQKGCMMIIENEAMHLPQNTWWWTNTRSHHTAANASEEYRLHLLFLLKD